MKRKFKNVRVEMGTGCFDLEISDNGIEFAKHYGINVEDDEELVKFYLENNFVEYKDLLFINDFEFEVEED